MNEAILCVDDDLSILGGFQRQFRKQFNIVSALNGIHGLETLTTKGPFAAVMSDYNMPGMNGLMFLRKVREQAPDSIRLMLTGKADAEAGLAAVNEGMLFRFLTKPCAPDVLAGVFTAALAQYRLVTAERLLKEEILESGVSVMSEVQRHLPAEVVTRIARIQTTVQRVVSFLKIGGLGRFEVAAMLSHIGCVGISGTLLKQAYTGGELSPDEQSRLQKHAGIGARIIANVPGLAPVAAMVERQYEVNKKFISRETLDQTDPILLGSQLLRLAEALDSFLLSNLTYVDALNRMSLPHEPHDPVLLFALRTTTKRDAAQRQRIAFLDRMQVGMLAQDTIVSHSGHLLAPKGALISPALFSELERHAAAGDIDLSSGADSQQPDSSAL